MDPVKLRLKNAAKQGTKAAYGADLGPIGFVETLEAAKGHANYAAAARRQPGPRRRQRLLFNWDGETAVGLNVNLDGT